MDNTVSAHSGALIKGLAAIVGEIAVGVNGPFLFGRFDIYFPLAVLMGVGLGAVLGVALASLGLAIRHRKPAPAPAHQIPADAHLRTH
ncbi:MAG TPA: hypothetical protein VGF16_14365 [Bryobacteraceae bacterium]|jgi:hypothetical protein